MDARENIGKTELVKLKDKDNMAPASLRNYVPKDSWNTPPYRRDWMGDTLLSFAFTNNLIFI